MSCCGSRRQSSVAGAVAAPVASPAPAAPRAQPDPTATFVYQGGTALTVLGPASGRRYRFERPGAEVHVDLRDVASFAAVPHVRRVRGR